MRKKYTCTSSTTDDGGLVQSGELDAAANDLHELLGYEPGNKEAAKELQRVKAAVEKQQRREAETFRDVLKVVTG